MRESNCKPPMMSFLDNAMILYLLKLIIFLFFFFQIICSNPKKGTFQRRRCTCDLKGTWFPLCEVEKWGKERWLAGCRHSPVGPLLRSTLELWRSSRPRI